jgi:hypothetical protein
LKHPEFLIFLSVEAFGLKFKLDFKWFLTATAIPFGTRRRNRFFYQNSACKWLCFAKASKFSRSAREISRFGELFVRVISRKSGLPAGTGVAFFI